MFSRLRREFARFLRDETAPSVIEYAMLVAGVAVVLIAVVYMLGGGARSAIQQAGSMAPPSTSPSSPQP
jgi:Flp pilus assembly pilin Flp